MTKIPIFKVWVMAFIDTSEVEIFSSAESAYAAAREYVQNETPEYIKKDMIDLEQRYVEDKDHFYVDDFLWVDSQNIITVVSDNSPI